jgi:6-pyruvoyltetrahydropterin/6-carboxytetrahydropterin synthase
MLPPPNVTVTKRYEWDMGHRLPQHEGKCRRLHGHRYVVEVDFTGPVIPAGRSAGMVVDFDDVKTLLDTVIGYWDHRTMLQQGDPIVDGHSASWHTLYGIFFVPFPPTAENIAREILLSLQPGAPAQVTRVRVYETPSGWAEVRA